MARTATATGAHNVEARKGVEVGEVVQFRIGAAVRPLVVVDVDPGEIVSGDLFLDYRYDVAEDWVIRNLSFRPMVHARHTWVEKAEPGSKIGQYVRRG